MSERLWGVNEIYVFSFLSCDYPLQRGGCHLLVTAKSWYKERKNLLLLTLANVAKIKPCYFSTGQGG